MSDNGDSAVTKYAQKFDGSTRTQHRLSQEEIDAAIALTPQPVQDDIKEAQSNIRRFALAQPAQNVVAREPAHPALLKRFAMLFQVLIELFFRQLLRGRLR